MWEDVLFLAAKTKILSRMIHLTTSHNSEFNPQSVSSSHPSPCQSESTPVAIKIDGMQAFLSQFDKCIDALVYLYLQSIANDGMVCQSGYAIARQLGIYRVTLSRILNRLEQQCAISITPYSDNDNHPQQVCIHLLLSQENNVTHIEENVTHITEDVTAKVENVTHIAENVTTIEEDITPTEDIAKPVTFVDATDPEEVTSVEENVTPATTTDDDEPKKKNKKENAPTTPKEKNKIKNPHSRTRARKSTQTLDKRRQTFIESLTPFIPTYGMEMVNAFIDYWTEPNRSCSRMRFELQRTWSLPLRLATWARHDRVFAQRTAYIHRPTSNECVAHAQQWAIAETARVVREAEMARRQHGQRPWHDGCSHGYGTSAHQALLPF